MAGGFQIVVDDEQVVIALGKVEQSAEDKAGLFRKIGAGMLLRAQKRFESESAPDGSKWPGLSPRTAAKRVGKGRRGTANMLRVSNRLYNSMTYRSDENSAEAGTNVVYAAIQNNGGEIVQPERQQEIHLAKVKGRTRFVKANRVRKETRVVTMKARTITIPAREFLGFGDGDRTEILHIVEEHFRSGGFDSGGK